MPKKNIDEEKKKELEKLINEIKEGAPDTSKAEVEELEKLLSDILSEEKKPLGRRIFDQVVAFIIHTVVMYVVCLLAFGFFFKQVTIENKFLIFLIAGIISIVLVIFERVPRDPFRKHFIKLNALLLLGIIFILCMVNHEFYRVFSFSIVWLFYIVIVEAIYFLFEYSFLKKLRLA